MAPRKRVDGLGQSIALLAEQVFEKPKLEKLYKTLTNRWDRYQSLHAAMKLMERHGVSLSEEEEKKLSSMDEGAMIEALVQKMPMSDKVQFQQFFLQLQIIVSTATKVRQALEASRPDLVEAALDEAESTGMSSYILKMAVVSAGYEVVSLRREHESWVKDSEHKMSKLVRGQEDSMKARKKLAQAQASLAASKAKNDSKTKNVLMALAGGSASAVMQSAFVGWRDAVKAQIEEREIYSEFKERLEHVERLLIEYKSKHLKNISGVVNRKYAESNSELLKHCFTTWQEDIANEKFFKENAELISNLEGKLQEAAEQQHATIQKIILKMFGDSEAALLKLVWQGFMSFHHEYQKNKEMEDQVKKMEKGLKDRMKGKGSDAQSVLNKMSGATNSALLQTSVSAWAAHWREAKEEAVMAEKLAKANSKFSNFGSLNKGHAQNAMDRARIHQEQMLLIECMYAWRIDIKMELLLRTHQSKIEGKKAQLQKVQGMFRDFASKLESGIKSGQDSERDFKEGARMQKARRQMTRQEGAVSLPDIHSSKAYSPKAHQPNRSPEPDRPRSRDRSSGREKRPSGGNGYAPAPGPPPVPAHAYPNAPGRA